MFTTFNYSITTFSPWEWFFVFDPDKGKADVLPAGMEWPTEQYPDALVASTGIYNNYIYIYIYIYMYKCIYIYIWGYAMYINIR